MKKLITIIAAIAVGFGVAYYWLGRQPRNQTAQSGAVTDWQSEKAALEEALRRERSRGPQIRNVTTTEVQTVTNATSADEILERLTQLRPDDGEDSRNRVLRQIVHQFQLLAEIGPPALPVIRKFIAQNKDIDYTHDEVNEAGERNARNDRWASRNQVRTDFLMPPSLRLGLVDVLDQIGGPDAEQVMIEMLQTTGRGVEVAFLARLLHENEPGKYKEMALNAAKELLANLPAIDQPSRFDDNAKAYLYQVLTMYNDTSFAETAQGLMVSADGRIDRNALNYLNAALKEQSVTSIYAAYKDPRVTNQWERSNLLNVALAYTGPNAQANQMFSDVVANETIPSGMRAFTVSSLAGDWRNEAPKDPEVIKARMQLLAQLRPGVRDDRIVKAIDDAAINLQRILNGEAPPPIRGGPGSTP